MRKRKLAGIGVLLGVTALLFGGCNEKEAPQKLRVGVTYYDQNDTYLNELIGLFKESLKEIESDKLEVSVTIRDAAGVQKNQNDQVEELIDEGCNILCVNLVDRADPSEIIDLARESEVPIIFFNREPVAEDLRQWEKLYYVGADAFESGQLQGEILVEQCNQDFASIDKNGDGILQYVMLEGEAGHNDSMVRSMSVINKITESGYTVEKLADEIANWNRDQASNKITPFLNSYGDEIEVILANNDDMALGAADALKARGIDSQSDNWPVILGVDGTDVGLKAVEKGELLGTVLNDAKGQAQGMLELAGSLILKKDLSPEYTLQDGKYIRLPYQKVTAENVSEIQSRQSE